MAQGHKMEVLTEYGHHTITVVGQYNHLGNIAHHSGTTHKEIRRKIAQGNAAFSAQRRTLFQNPHFSVRQRADLFNTMVMSKVTYGMDSWLFEDKRTKSYFHSAIFRLYRRLLKIKPDAAISDDIILEQAHLPHPDIGLRITRLRYLALLYKCETVTPWAVIRQDQAWCQQIMEDLQWLWNLVSRTTKLRDPRIHFAEWEYILRYHRSYWKTILQRAQKLCALQHEDRLLLRTLHRDTLAMLETHGTLQSAPVKPALLTAQCASFFGCMQCQKRCRTRGGEGAHLFKVHGITAFERQWIASTACEACLKEYHSFDKLQNHLRTATSCRAVLHARRLQRPLAPGIGSSVNSQLRDQHDGLLPVLQGSGPLEQPVPQRAIERHHNQLMEALAILALDFTGSDADELFLQMKQIILQEPIGWTQTRETLVYLADSLTEEFLAEISVGRLPFLDVLDRLGDPNTWGFLTEVLYDTANCDHLYDLDLYEHWCATLADCD